MNSPQVITFIQNVVEYNAKYDRATNQYTLSIDEVSEYEIDEIVSLILSQDDILAAEAFGPDNPEWKDIMSSVHRALHATITSYDFQERYLDCIRNYIKPRIEKLLAEALDDFNGEHGCITELRINRESGLVAEHRI